MNYNLVTFETSFGRPDQLPEATLTELAFAGRSNLCKSTILIQIFNRKPLARVSAEPGKTATINFFRLENLRFADLPGYGYAKVSKGSKEKWGSLIATYFDGSRNLGLVFQLVDMRHSPTKDDLQMIDFLIENQFPFVIVLTKADKLKKTERERRLAALQQEVPCADQIRMIPFSAQTGEGVDQVREIIEEISAEDRAAEGEE